ncbi:MULTISPECIES: Ail/Lom family outer membrane beta-barrel protein [Xenorhabdus]|uniref:Ail/Lom family outer membrane beta-barrel protein n=1 Tax=Xenorhabdus TaxID=626 RepID=UPI00068FF3AA|nr:MULTISPECIES: Ail/Lom family outer membrane beta-barrel protein [Xenorhabdus]
MVTKKALLITLATSCLIYGSLANANSHTIGIGYAKSKIAKVTKLQGANVYYRYEWDSPISIVGTFTYMRGDDSLPSFLDYYSSRAVLATKYGGIPQGKLFAKYSGPVTEKPDAKYFSLMLGPAYRINDYVSIYGLLGISHTSFNAKRWTDSYLQNRPYLASVRDTDGYPGISVGAGAQVGKHVSIRVPQKTNNIAYGAGIEVNPVKNISLYFNYEGSITKYQKMTTDPFAYEAFANGRNGPYDTNSAKTKLIHGFNIGIGYKF